MSDFGDDFGDDFGGPFDGAVGGISGFGTRMDQAIGGFSRVGYDLYDQAIGGLSGIFALFDLGVGGLSGVAVRFDQAIGGFTRIAYDGYDQAAGGVSGFGTRFDQAIGGSSAIAAAAADEIRVYAARDATPDTETLIHNGTAPFAIIPAGTALPYALDFTSLTASGIHNYYFDFRRFNAYGIYTGSAGLLRMRINKSGSTYTALPVPPSRPDSLIVAPVSGNRIRVVATYAFGIDGPYQADTWYVWVFDNSGGIYLVAPPPDADFPIRKELGVARLDAVIEGPFIGDPELGFDVVVATYNSANDLWSGADDPNALRVATVITNDDVPADARATQIGLDPGVM